MKRRRQLLKEEETIKALINQKGEGENAARRAWKKVLDYFKANDELEGYNNLSVIKYIYERNKYKKETNEGKALNNYVTERTMYRYREKYVKCFYIYYDEEKKK